MKKGRKQPRIDLGTRAGLAAAALVLLVWGIVEANEALFVSRAKAGSEASETAPAPAVAPPTAAPMPTPVGGWRADPRWEEGVARGEEGLRILEETRRWHEEVGGDPFRYRYEMGRARAALEEAVSQLTALAADHPAAASKIRPELERYRALLGPLHKED